MRLAWPLLVLTACDPPLPRDCPRACEPDDRDRAQLSGEQLPARCRDICTLGACCELRNGAWSRQTFDCALPRGACVDSRADGARDA